MDLQKEEEDKSSPQETIKLGKIIKNNYCSTLELKERCTTNWEAFIKEKLLDVV